MASTRYQYETSPRKLEPEIKKKNKKAKLKIVEDVPRQKVKISSEQKKQQRKVTLIVIGVFLLLLTISYRNSQINEQFNNVQKMKRELSTLQKENEQTEVGIENSLNLNNIEQAAKEKLGMQKLTNKQTIYINLPKKDYVESPKESIVVKENENVIQKIISMFKK